MNTIKVSNITKRFNDKLVLDNISFEVKEGEIFGLIGPNGAGKSTLINIMTNLIVANNGSVEICGHDISKESIKAKQVMGLVPQDLALIEELNAYDNLEFLGSLYGLKGKELKRKINEALEITGLLDKKKEKVKKYSGGMKRRLNIAAAIMHDPKVLILDEPTVGVDPQSRNYIFDFLKRVSKEKKTTILYTSHYMEEIEELCSRVFIIDLGKEIAYGSKDEIKSLVFTDSKVNIEVTEVRGEIIAKLKQAPGVKEVKEIDNTLRVTITREFSLGKALTLLEEAHIGITKISYEDPKLEDVFLSLTGKSLRD